MSNIPGVSFTEDKTALIGTPATGVTAILLVGTACKGPTDPQLFDSSQLPDIINMYGPPDPYVYKNGSGNEPLAELTLVRAAIEMFAGGPPPFVWCVRVVDAGVVTGIGKGMTIETAVPADDGNFIFTAKYPGQWYNNWKFKVTRGYDKTGVADAGIDTYEFMVPSNSVGKYDSYLGATPTADRVSVYRFFGQTYVLEVGISGGSAPTLTETLSALQADSFLSQFFSISKEGTAPVRTKDTAGVFKDLFSIVADGWNTNNASTGGTNWSSDDSAIVTSANVTSALDKGLKLSARIVVIGGADESVLAGAYLSAGVTHAKVASVTGNDNERIYFCGSGNYATESALITAIESSPFPLGEERAVAITPGYKISNPFYGVIYGSLTSGDSNTTITLSGGYAAARVAGLFSSRAPQQDSLGQNIGVISNFEFDLSRGSLSRAINASFTVLAKGFDGSPTVRKAMTTAGLGDPFEKIIIRLVIDDIRYALRTLYQKFIGEHNLRRMRKLMQDKSTSLLGNYVRQEMIDSDFSLIVTATRQQEIDGKTQVDAFIKPIYSIEFIPVNIILG